MKTTSEFELIIAQTVANHCARFVKNISKYRRQPDGRYEWAYTGECIVIRVSAEFIHMLTAKFGALPDFHDNSVTLDINGKTIGTIHYVNPYAYPQLFIYIKLASEMKNNPKVILRFAHYGGYKPQNFDIKLLEIDERKQDSEEFDLFL